MARGSLWGPVASVFLPQELNSTDNLREPGRRPASQVRMQPGRHPACSLVRSKRKPRGARWALSFRIIHVCLLKALELRTSALQQ